ncbi:hypothetical protein TL16_g06451 [Triparma laevis f. inornata]|uniref:Sm protein B n=1 Tax=Triparma laevis f. inornata TaxID=1714386 RepID=A0A9W7EAL4_9STRA|nr:hypothetical protein TL16_g06451 [Triparma laevis f. inornata]
MPPKQTGGSAGKASKLMGLIDSRLRVVLVDRYVEKRKWHRDYLMARTRVLVGTFLAFDKYLNLVLSSCEENRTTTTTENGSTTETEQRRSLGLVILRGENVVSVTVEGPAPVEKKARVAKNVGGVVAGMGRGAAAPAMGLGGAVAGVGGGVGGYGGMGRGGGF